MVEDPNKEKGELPYPNSPFRVGDVIYKPHPEDMLVNDKDLYTQIQVFGRKSISDFPHIFRKMHWSEGRELSEMPRWVKDKEIGKIVIKVHVYQLISGEWWFVSEANKDIHHVTSLSIFTPATEAEYLEYLKSKEK